MRFFNTAGPVNCKEHYCLLPLSRFDLKDISSLIEQKKYFVLHAPRQTGKTTYLLALMDHLNAGGNYRCLYFNVEPAQAAREDVRQGMRAILNEMASSAVDFLKDEFLKTHWLEVLESSGEYAALGELLSLWAKESPLPLVVLIDEIDSLIGDTLISVLRQLRAGYLKRPGIFPQSIVLCGVRDVRDPNIQEEFFVTSLSVKDISGHDYNQFSRGEQIQFEVSIVNKTNSNQTLTFTSTKIFDFIVLPSDTSNIIWQWSKDKGFGCAITSLEFEPGEEKNFSVIWDQIDNNGAIIDAGLYEAQGSIEGEGGSDGAVPNDLTPSPFRSHRVSFKCHPTL